MSTPAWEALRGRAASILRRELGDLPDLLQRRLANEGSGAGTANFVADWCAENPGAAVKIVAAIATAFASVELEKLEPPLQG